MCVFSGVGVEVNVVNFYQYRIAELKKETCGTNGSYGQLYTSTANPSDTNRTELVREELNPVTGNPFANTCPEIVAEYAVDLKFEVTATPAVGPNPISMFATPATGSVYNYNFAAPGNESRPQRVRSVHTRLSVRSREADRTADLAPPFSSGTNGLYRIGVGPNQTRFARVRTLQADIAVPNHFGVVW